MIITRETFHGAEEAMRKVPFFVKTFRQSYRYLMKLWKDLKGTVGEIQ
ncbi:MAG: hypothetical protein K0R54_3277 [Clostridiaceae bacterium]|jgi:hypothetical protein|nr:hypothetical protein [Clostridiaceae bacterium]